MCQRCKGESYLIVKRDYLGPIKSGLKSSLSPTIRERSQKHKKGNTIRTRSFLVASVKGIVLPKALNALCPPCARLGMVFILWKILL